MKLTSSLNNRICIFITFSFFIITFAVYYLTGEGSSTPFHYFVPLSDAFLHGRLHVLEKPPWLNELLDINGKFYVIYPPMPAIMLLPQVAIFGLEANQTLASVILGSINVSIVFLIVRRITKNTKLQIWMTLFFAFGTIHWYLASIGKAWFFAHIVSFFFLSLAIYETLSRKRPFLIALLLGASFWSRLPTILSLPFFIILLSDQWLKIINQTPLYKRLYITPLLKFGSGVSIFIFLNFFYNYLRFGTPFDIAYEIISKEYAWVFTDGLFSISYIPTHLWILFLKPPVLTSNPPYVMPSLIGMSILITSPAFIFSVLAGIRDKIALACWSSILPIAIIEFTYGNAGWMQFGYRFAMDFYPFLIVLTTLGIKNGIAPDNDLRFTHKLLIILSVIVNLWGVLWINKFGWSSMWG